LGTPILESQACGVPVVSNYIKNITDTIIEKNKGGYFLELNAKRWAKTIEKAIEIPKEVLIENAKHVSNICSSKLIDNENYKKINQLILNES
jgi:glycosyltransferase involved in cell wall biosynthesis